MSSKDKKTFIWVLALAVLLLFGPIWFLMYVGLILVVT